MSRSSSFLTALMTAALIASASPARADEATELAAAQVLLEDGNRAAAAGDFAGALERFRAAYGRYRSAPILLNIATALRRLGRDAEAGSAYEDYLRDPRANPQRLPEVQRALGEIDLNVGRVALGVSDPGARLYLDGGELVGFQSGRTLRVQPGDHTFVAVGAEGPPVGQPIHIGPRESRVVYLNLGGSSAPHAPTPGPTFGPPPEKVVSGLLLGFGAAGTATGIGLGLATLVIYINAGDHCLGGTCDADGVAQHRQARDFGIATALTLGGGLGLLVVHGILRASDPAFRLNGALSLASHVGVNVTPHGSSLTLQAAW